MATSPFKYRAFISYAHADEKWARWLHRSLETYRIPARLVGQKTEFGPVPAKLAPVFRDRDELASATDLGEKLTAALENAATLIVICSRASAKSHWVNEEILAYKRLGRSNRIFSLIVDGEPYSEGVPGEEQNECFPRALRYQIGDSGDLTGEPAEPIAADARPGKDGRNNAKIKLIAGMLGLGFDDLRQRELQRRNRRLAYISVSAIAGMVFAIVLAGAAVIARNEAERQRLRAETEAETARQTANFMIDLFTVSDPSEARGRSITAREILTKGAERISTELSDQPEIQTSLMDTIGKVYTNLGLYQDAAGMLEGAVALRRNLTDLAPEDYARSLLNLANVLTEQAEYERAADLYQQALSALEENTSGDSPTHIDVTAALAELYFRTGEYEKAEPLLESVLEERLRLFGRNDLSVADAIEELGLNKLDQGNHAEAEIRLRESLELRLQILGKEPHPDISENLNNLALVLSMQDKNEEAVKLYERMLEMDRQLYGGAHPAIAIGLNNLAEQYRYQRRFAEAEQLYREALAMQIGLLGREHPEVAKFMSNLARNYQDMGDYKKAIDLVRETLEIQEKTLGHSHPDVARTLRLYGQLYAQMGEKQRAEQTLHEALELQTELLGPDHPSTAVTRMLLAEALLALDQNDAALEQATLSHEILSTILPADHELALEAAGVRGEALEVAGDYAAAEKLLLPRFRQLSQDPTANAMVLGEARSGLRRLYLAWGKPDVAEQF